MSKTFKAFKEQAALPAAPSNTETAPSYPENPDTHKVLYPDVPEKMASGVIRDFNTWFDALNAKCHIRFPSDLIESRLNLYGYTAYLDGDYVIEDDEVGGQEVYIMYKEYGDPVQGIDRTTTVSNAVIIVDWSREGGDFYVTGRVEAVTPEEFSDVLNDLDAPDDNVDPEDLIDDESMVVNEGLKLIATHKHENGDHAKVYRNSDDNEYQVKYFKGGKHLSKADSFHDDKEDAHATAKHQVANLKEEIQIDESKLTPVNNKAGKLIGHYGKTFNQHGKEVKVYIPQKDADDEPFQSDDHAKAYIRGLLTKEEVESLDETRASTILLNLDIPDTKEITPAKIRASLPAARDTGKLWKIKSPETDKEWDISSKPKLKSWKIFKEAAFAKHEPKHLLNPGDKVKFTSGQHAGHEGTIVKGGKWNDHRAHGDSSGRTTLYHVEVRGKKDVAHIDEFDKK